MSPIYRLESVTCASSDIGLPPLTEMYLIPPTFNEQVNLKTSLEFFWGLEKNGLEIETPLNKLNVRTDFAHLLNERRCVLLPSEEIQRSIQELVSENYMRPLQERIAFTDAFPPARYQYNLFPLTSKDTLYHRNPSEPDNYTKLDFDFKRPVIVESTAHPFFVSHFFRNSLSKEVITANRNLRSEDYCRIFGIFAMWIKQVPASFCIGTDSVVVWREHRHPCSDSGSSSRHQLSEERKRPRPRSPSSANAQPDGRAGRKKQRAQGDKSEGHKLAVYSTSDDSGSHRLSAQNLRLLESQMDQTRPNEPRRRQSQSPPFLISDHSGFSSVQRQRRRRKSVSLPLSPTGNDLPRLVYRWLQDSESGEPIFEEIDGDREAVRVVDDAIQYSRKPPQVLAPGGRVLDHAYITSTQWAWDKYKVHL